MSTRRFPILVIDNSSAISAELEKLRKRTYLAYGYSEQSAQTTLKSGLTNHPAMLTWYMNDKKIIVACASLVVISEVESIEKRIEAIIDVIRETKEIKYPAAYFTRLCVDPNYWGQRLSEPLYQKRIEFMKAQGIKTGIFNSTNYKMIQKFKKKNWIHVGEIEPELLKPDIPLSQIYIKYF